MLTIATENQEQMALVSYLNHHPLLSNCFCKLNNEGRRTPGQGHHLKRMGLRVGASDLFIYYPTAKHAGLWLEMKQKRKYTPSERRKPTWVAQEAFQGHVRSLGYAAEIAFGWEHAKEIIDNYLKS
jgi:hypothetical protein